MRTHISHVLAVIFFCAAHCVAQDANKTDPSTQPTSKLLSDAARSNLLLRSGGFVQVPVSGPRVLILDTQSRIQPALLNAFVIEMQEFLRLPCSFKTQSPTVSRTDAARALADTNVAVVVVVCDAPDQPSLLIAPENRWAAVNVAALKAKATADDLVAMRVRKEVWRALGYLMGAANSVSTNCLLRPVFSPADLDALPGKNLSFEPIGKIVMQAQRMGITPIRMTTYRKAVEEGWASAPTNDFQEAIWTELHR